MLRIATLRTLRATGFGAGTLQRGYKIPVATRLPRGFTDTCKRCATMLTLTAEPGRAGIAVDEKELQRVFREMQEQRTPEAGSMKDTSELQKGMQNKPDCGENLYVGAGKMKDKVAVVTGGDSGIGRAVVIAFAREGADIVLVYKAHDEDANDVQALVTKAGRRCLLLKRDISSREACEEIVSRTMSEFGRLDCLVNHAGVQYLEESIAKAGENLETIFASNFFSNVWLAGAAEKVMADHSGCTIIETTSINAFRGNPTLISYSASKGAQQAFARSLARKLIGRGIRVNAVAPGPIWAPLIKATSPQAEASAEFGSSTPMGRAGQPVECAPAYVFLASSDSTFVNGATIHVDGGEFTSS